MNTAPNPPPSGDENTAVQGGLAEPPAGETSKPPEPVPKPEPKAGKAPAPKGKRAAAGEDKAPKVKERRREKKKAEAPGPAPPAPPDGVKESLVRFVAVRTRERTPVTRRFAPGPIRALARSRLEERPEVLESYRKNRRRGEQEALPLIDALAEELMGRSPEAEAESKK